MPTDYHIFEMAFGDAPAYQIGAEPPQTPAAQYSQMAATGQGVVWERVRILAGNYPTAKGEKSYEAFTFPGATYVSFKYVKNILETQVYGNSGTVFEKVSNGHWEMQIRGMLTSGCLADAPATIDNVYPHAELKQMQNIVNVDAPLNVVGDLFSWLGVQHILFNKEWNVPIMEQYPYMQAFEISAVSIEATELILTQANGQLSLTPAELNIL